MCEREREFKVQAIISKTVCDSSSIAVWVATVCINPSDDQSVLALQYLSILDVSPLACRLYTSEMDLYKKYSKQFYFRMAKDVRVKQYCCV